MEYKPFALQVLPFAEKYFDDLSLEEQSIVMSDIEDMCIGEIGAVHTKQLRGPIRELIAGHHRFTYFLLSRTLYFVRGFRKKSAKTPP
ncbi:MAG: hypothetical protein Q7S01_02430 [bacterium]|nr:hypothetical protein [bacterium]